MKKKHLLILQNISQNIPKEYKDKLLITVKSSPALEKAVKDFLAGKGAKYMAERWKGKETELKHLYDSGFFSKTEQVTDPKIEKKIDKYLSEKIEEAKRNGLLPEKVKVDKLTKKAKKNAKRTITIKN